LFEAPVWLKLLLSIMVLDLIAQYFVHYLLHKVKWMWRLHTVHHSDKNVDVTTGTRHHPFDFIIRETFALIAVVIMGMPIAFYLFYTRQYFASEAIGQSAELHYRYSEYA